MLENIAIEIAEELNNAGINAVTAFNASELEDVSAFVCVGLKSARISSSGLGNYIGVCTEDGQLKEMYGEKAELVENAARNARPHRSTRYRSQPRHCNPPSG